jgi:hypothetical protein
MFLNMDIGIMGMCIGMGMNINMGMRICMGMGMGGGALGMSMSAPMGMSMDLGMKVTICFSPFLPLRRSDWTLDILCRLKAQNIMKKENSELIIYSLRNVM